MRGCMNVDIRRCIPADAAALAIVGQATFLETYAHMLDVADIVHHCAHQHAEGAYAGWLASPGHAFWLAEVIPGRAPVGFAMLSPPDLPITLLDGDVELKRIYVLSKFHDGGHGARLMAQAVEAAREMGARRLLLGVNARNARAIAFYTRQGFIQAGVRKFQVGATIHDDFVLAREL
jgi:ribosomal protein S18 acetylase RimI-like enzyme